MRFFSFIFLVVLWFPEYGQPKKDLGFSNYPGYIVTMKNDTITGEVKLNEKDELERYMKMHFIEKSGGPVKHYLPIKIHAYGYDGNDYRAVKYDNQWVFMQVICSGKISVFEFKAPTAWGNERKESAYFVMKGGMEELSRVYIDSKLKKQIKGFINDDKELWKTYDGRDMDFSAMVQLIRSYNERNP